MSNEAMLTAETQRFHNAITANEILMRLILGTVQSEKVPASDIRALPNFSAEPWQHTPNDPALPTMGLRLNMSASNQSGSLAATVSSFLYLEVLVTARERTERTLLETSNPEVFFDASDALAALSVARAVRTKAALHFALEWQGFCQTAKILGASVDPASGTFSTLEAAYPA